jgi:hypothetical protein
MNATHRLLILCAAVPLAIQHLARDLRAHVKGDTMVGEAQRRTLDEDRRQAHAALTRLADALDENHPSKAVALIHAGVCMLTRDYAHLERMAEAWEKWSPVVGSSGGAPAAA